MEEEERKGEREVETRGKQREGDRSTIICQVGSINLSRLCEREGGNRVEMILDSQKIGCRTRDVRKKGRRATSGHRARGGWSSP